ncbi:hypothetical protein L581_0255 [Serratia fonticola AU-AP2C]|nr:hypothetical protein L581_0255 [Serratia fonticola AU-AP2C]
MGGQFPDYLVILLLLKISSASDEVDIHTRPHCPHLHWYFP